MQTLADLTWLAGFLEGEGTFLGRVTAYTTASGEERTCVSAHITAGTVDRDVAERAANLMGGSVDGPYGPYGKDHHQPHYVARLTRTAEARDLMDRLMPHMGERRRAKIQEVLDATG